MLKTPFRMHYADITSNQSNRNASIDYWFKPESLSAASNLNWIEFYRGWVFFFFMVRLAQSLITMRPSQGNGGWIQSTKQIHSVTDLMVNLVNHLIITRGLWLNRPQNSEASISFKEPTIWIQIYSIFFPSSSSSSPSTVKFHFVIPSLFFLLFFCFWWW